MTFIYLTHRLSLFCLGILECLVVNDYDINFSGFRHVWESKADGSFVVSEDTYNEPLGRGTEIRLHLKEEAGEYLEESKLKVSGLEILDL